MQTDVSIQVLEQILSQLNHVVDALQNQKNILNLNEFCHYTGTSPAYAYKLTSQSLVPHYKPHGKKIFFKRSEVDEWLTQGRVKTYDEIEKEAANYLLSKG